MCYIGFEACRRNEGACGEVAVGQEQKEVCLLVVVHAGPNKSTSELWPADQPRG